MSNIYSQYWPISNQMLPKLTGLLYIQFNQQRRDYVCLLKMNVNPLRKWANFLLNMCLVDSGYTFMLFSQDER